MTCLFPKSVPAYGAEGNRASLFPSRSEQGNRLGKHEKPCSALLPTRRFPGLPAISGLLQCLARTAAKVVAHARYTVFQMAEVAVPRNLFGRILEMIEDLRPRPVA